MAIDLANGVYVSQGKVFNTNYIKELGPKKTMSVIADSLEKKWHIDIDHGHIEKIDKIEQWDIDNNAHSF